MDLQFAVFEVFLKIFSSGFPDLFSLFPHRFGKKNTTELLFPAQPWRSDYCFCLTTRDEWGFTPAPHSRHRDPRNPVNKAIMSTRKKNTRL